jgi:hemerythrin-like metal-binding protein
MEGKKYPWLKEQKTFHKYFVEQIENFSSQMKESGCTPEVMEDLRQLLVDWFLNHIKEHDKKIADYLKFRQGDE